MESEYRVVVAFFWAPERIRAVVWEGDDPEDANGIAGTIACTQLLQRTSIGWEPIGPGPMNLSIRCGG